MSSRGLPTGHTNLYYRANSYINSLSMYQEPLEVIRGVIDCVSSGTSRCEQINDVYDQFLSDIILWTTRTLVGTVLWVGQNRTFVLFRKKILLRIRTLMKAWGE